MLTFILCVILCTDCFSQGFSISSQKSGKIIIKHEIKEKSPLLSSYSTYILIPKDAKNLSVCSKQLPQKNISYSVLNIRDCNIILLNIIPYHHDSISKSKSIIKDIEIEISFQSDNYKYIEERYRNREWDDIIKGIVLNPEFIDDFDYDEQLKKIQNNKQKGCQYLIISSNDDGIKQWADTLSRFRNEQGILTEVIKVNEIGENLPVVIRDFLKDIYNNWDLVPSAVLLLGDYSDNQDEGITSFYLKDHPEYNLRYYSDNKFIDFNNDNLPEMSISRLPAADAEQAELMVKKTIRYECEPSANPGYYHNPVTAMGFEESRWFQLCSEIIAGYFETKGKEPKRLNAVNTGTPDSIWSSGENTDDIINYFGSNGLNYIPDNLKHLKDWDSDERDISDAINEGTFIVQHRDHGTFQNWSNPYFSNHEINKLENKDLSFIMSANCQTGDFSYGEGDNDCFAERFLRVKNGAVGVIAASQYSYSFVNDTYVWGFYDYLWNDFMPTYGSNDISFKYPSFANVYGKFFLKQSTWPYISIHKDVTYNLFHYFGDSYLQLNTEMPKEIEISYPKEILSNCETFSICKDDDVRVAFSIDGEIIATSFDSDSIINIRPLYKEGKIKVVATKQDHYRHEGYIEVKSFISEDEIEIYPNPAKDILFVESKGIKVIEIYSSLGQKIMEISNDEDSERIVINCGDLKKGLFHLQIIYEDKRVGRSFIVTD